eukprot:SAG11_NODE_384_length_9897_cov_11.158502_3_plen_197_part_00
MLIRSCKTNGASDELCVQTAALMAVERAPAGAARRRGRPRSSSPRHGQAARRRCPCRRTLQKCSVTKLRQCDALDAVTHLMQLGPKMIGEFFFAHSGAVNVADRCWQRCQVRSGRLGRSQGSRLRRRCGRPARGGRPHRVGDRTPPPPRWSTCAACTGHTNDTVGRTRQRPRRLHMIRRIIVQFSVAQARGWAGGI